MNYANQVQVIVNNLSHLFVPTSTGLVITTLVPQMCDTSQWNFVCEIGLCFLHGIPCRQGTISIVLSIPLGGSCRRCYHCEGMSRTIAHLLTLQYFCVIESVCLTVLVTRFVPNQRRYGNILM